MATKDQLAEEATPHTPRTTEPIVPRIGGAPGEACWRMWQAARGEVNLAIAAVSAERTLNMPPTVATYKVELLEYLRQKAQP